MRQPSGSSGLHPRLLQAPDKSREWTLPTTHEDEAVIGAGLVAAFLSPPPMERACVGEGDYVSTVVHRSSVGAVQDRRGESPREKVSRDQGVSQSVGQEAIVVCSSAKETHSNGTRQTKGSESQLREPGGRYGRRRRQVSSLCPEVKSLWKG